MNSAESDLLRCAAELANRMVQLHEAAAALDLPPEAKQTAAELASEAAQLLEITIARHLRLVACSEP